MNNKKLSIITVSYNTRDMLDHCLSTVLINKVNLELEIFVIDNASTDGSVQMVRKKYPTVNLIENSENIGFAAACNQAIRLVNTEYILLLNPDVIISEDTLEKMINHMEKHKRVGITGCKIINESGKIERSAFPRPSLFNEINDILGKFRIERILPANLTRRKYDKLAKTGKEPFSVYWVCGACLMIRKKVVDEIGLLDENYFLFSEDVDWCCRAKEKGWVVTYYPWTKVIHYIGFSSRNNIDGLRNRIYFSYKRRFYFAIKYFSKSSISILKLIILLDLLFSILVTNIRRDISPIRKKTMFKTYVEVFRMILSLNKI
jgi:GT2 family glycosyltransferase